MSGLTIFPGISENDGDGAMLSDTADLTIPEGVTEELPADNPFLFIAANNTNLPYNYATENDWVHNTWTVHTTGDEALVNPRFLFINGIASQNAELDAGYDFVLRCGVLCNGTFTQGRLANGDSDKNLAKEWGWDLWKCEVTIPPNTTFVVTNRRVATDNGAAGSYDVIFNTGAIVPRPDGRYAGTNTSVDYTLGVGCGFGAQPGAVTVSSNGQVTGVAVASAGQGYTNGGITLTYWYGPAGVNSPGALIPGVSAPTGGFGVIEGGGLSSIHHGDTGGSGMSAANPPLAFVGGANGYSTAANQAVYGPSMILGEGENKKAMLAVGDSILAGFGSTDDTGNLKGSYGYLEQIMGGTYGFCRWAAPGNAASAWVGNSARKLAILDTLINTYNLRISDGAVCLGTNDGLLTNPSLATLEASVSSVAAALRSRVTNVWITTLPPATSAANGYINVAGQVAVNSAFNASGSVLQFNARLSAGTGVPRNGVIPLALYTRSSASPYAWRVSAYDMASSFTLDGIHPTRQTGIPYLVANLPSPVL